MTPAAETVLRVEHVDKRYVRRAETVHAVRDVSFALEPSGITVVSGPSGSGKTTLLNLVIGWEEPDAGRIVGRPEGEGWRSLAVVPQSLGLLHHLTMEENITLAERVERVRFPHLRLMDELGIAHLGARFPDETSLGEQQRVAIARALVVGPRLLVLDEPTSHQDDASADRIVAALLAAAAAGSMVLVATHDSRVTSVATQLLSILDGRVVPGPPTGRR